MESSADGVAILYNAGGLRRVLAATGKPDGVKGDYTHLRCMPLPNRSIVPSRVSICFKKKTGTKQNDHSLTLGQAITTAVLDGLAALEGLPCADVVVVDIFYKNTHH